MVHTHVVDGSSPSIATISRIAMAVITGKHWAFLACNAEHKMKILCPGMMKLEEIYFDIEANGLKQNFYQSAQFKSKEEAIDAMIAQLQSLKNSQ